MLRRLRRLLPDATLRVYADDLAAVFVNGETDMTRAVPIFEAFARISGLRLNVGKTAAVPLWPVQLDALRAGWAARMPSWAGIQVASSAKYLGLQLGPGRRESSWLGPLAKYADRAEAWSAVGCGMALTARAYSAYIAAVLQFVLQYEALPADWPQHEASALRRLVPGPGN